MLVLDLNNEEREVLIAAVKRVHDEVKARSTIFDGRDNGAEVLTNVYIKLMQSELMDMKK